MPSSPDPKKLKEAGMDAAFNPKGGTGKEIMEKIAGFFAAPTPSPSPAPTQCPNCGHTIGEQINYPKGAS